MSTALIVANVHRDHSSAMAYLTGMTENAIGILSTCDPCRQRHLVLAVAAGFVSHRPLPMAVPQVVGLLLRLTALVSQMPFPLDDSSSKIAKSLADKKVWLTNTISSCSTV